MQLLTFLIVTVLFWLAGNILLKLVYKMIQHDGALDVMFGWQKKLDDWYGKAAAGSKKHRIMHDMLGGCQICTSSFISIVWFACYYLVSRYVVGYWLTDGLDSWLLKGLISLIWFGMYWSIGTWFGLLLLVLKTKRK